MSKLRALFVSVLFLFVILVGAAFVVPSFLDWNKYKQPIQELLAKKWGYDARIVGDLSFDVLPYPRLVVGKSSIHLKDTNVEIASFESLQVAVELVPLLSRQVKINSVRLIDPKVHIVKNKFDRFNFISEKLEKEAGLNHSDLNASAAKPLGKGGADMLSSVSLQHFEIVNGVVSYQDLRTAQTYDVQNINVRLSAETFDGPFKVAGDLAWMGRRFDVSLATGRLAADQKNFPVKLDLSVDEQSGLTYSGVISMDGALDLQGEVRIHSEDLRQWSEIVPLGDVAKMGVARSPLFVEGLLSVNADALKLDNARFGISDYVIDGDIALDGIGADFNWNNKNAPVLKAKFNVEESVDFDVIAKLFEVRRVEGDEPKVTQKGVNEKQGAKAELLFAQSFVMPLDMDVDLELDTKQLVFRGGRFDQSALNVMKKKGIVEAKFVSEGDVGEIALDMKAKFQSMSFGNGGEVVYADPKITGDLSLMGGKGQDLYRAVLGDGAIDPLVLELMQQVDVSAHIAMEPEYVELKDVNIGLHGFDAVGRVRYEPFKSGHDSGVVDIGMNIEQLDLDRFLSLKHKDDPVPLDVKGGDGRGVKKAVSGFVLPVDVSALIQIDEMKYMQREIKSVVVKGALKNNTLKIENFKFKGESGIGGSASGTIGDVREFSPFDVNFDVTSEDVERSLALFDVKQDVVLVPMGRGRIKARVHGTPKSAMFTANVEVLGSSIDANGQVDSLLDKPVLNTGSVRVVHSDFENFVKMFVSDYDSGLAGRAKMDVFVDVEQQSQDVYNIKQLRAKIGQYALDADALVKLDGDKPEVTGFVKGRKILLSAFMNRGDVKSIKKKKKKSSKSSASNDAGLDARWSRTAINTGWMHSADIDLKFSFDDLIYDAWHLKSLSGQAVLKDGVMDLYQVESGLHGGKMIVSGRVASDKNPREPVTFNLSTNLKEVSFPGLVKSFGLPDVIRGEGGIVNFDLEANSTGLSPAALVFGLTGKGSIDGQGIVLRGFDLDKLARTVAKESSEFKQWKRLGQQAIKGVLKGGTTRFDAMLGTFVIEQGVVKSDDLTLQSAKTIVRNKGHVSLPQWSVDVRTVVDILEPEDAPDLEYHYSGPIENPAANMQGNGLLEYGIQKAINKVLDDKAGELLKKILKVPPANDNGQGSGSDQGRSQKPEDVFKNILKDVISR